MSDSMKIIESTPENAGQFAMCGYKNKKNEGYCLKVAWLKERFKEGMRHKVLYSEADGAVGAVEYIPGEYAWRPVNAGGFFFIHCIYIIPKKYKEQGYGQRLLESCIQDAGETNVNGVAVLTRKGTFMASKSLFLKAGFKTVDTAPPDFELLALNFHSGTPVPSIKSEVKSAMHPRYRNLTIITSYQCPYAEKAVKEIVRTAEVQYQIRPVIEILSSCEEAQNTPCAFGTFCIMYQGKVIADHPVSKRRFCNIMDKLR